MPAGSPEVRARGFALDQRYSVIAALRISARYAFDFASYFSANIFWRTSCFFGVSTVVLLRAQRTTISMPCLVVSGGVSRPTGVFSRRSRSDSGKSADVLVTSG